MAKKEDANSNSEKVVKMGRGIIAYIDEMCGPSDEDQIYAFHALTFALTNFISERSANNRQALLLIGMAITTVSLGVNETLGTHRMEAINKNIN